MAADSRITISGLPLESSRWTELKHAYGYAKDTPSLLRQLENGAPAALSELYGSINHQGSVYPASYAAVPHLARIASNAATLKARVDALCLLGSIHLSREPDALQSLANDLREWYAASLIPARALMEESLNEEVEPNTVPYLLSSAAAVDGMSRLARALDDLESEELLASCPQCDQELFVWPSGSNYQVADADPVFNEGVSFIPVRSTTGISRSLAEEHDWIVRRCALQAARRLFDRAHALFGEATCPACKADFCLFEALEQF